MLTVGEVALSVVLFIVAGLLEIGGGWLVWQTIRENRFVVVYTQLLIACAGYEAHDTFASQPVCTL
jgi:drug/metabolite transporter superfamily protein YnfA